MFARKVAARLRPNSLTQFANIVEQEILPWLRQQEGFLGLIVLAAPDGSEVATISFWDQERSAQACNASRLPEALNILDDLLDGTPYVKTFEVVSSTLQSLQRSALAGAESETLIQEPSSPPWTCRSCGTSA